MESGKSGEKSMSIFVLRSIPATHPEYSPHACNAVNDRGGNENHCKRSRRGGGRGLSWEFFVGVFRPALQILTLFQTKNCQFPHPFSYPILDLA